MIQGAIRLLPTSHDYSVQPSLQGRTPDDTNLMEWTEPDAETEDNFARATSFGIVNGELVFDFTPLPEQPQTSEMTEALEILGVTL
jgi:hypothetical protein